MKTPTKILSANAARLGKAWSFATSIIRTVFLGVAITAYHSRSWAGTLTTIASFTDGTGSPAPLSGGPLIASPDGSTLYGTTSISGSGSGIVYSVRTNGSGGITTLFDFPGSTNGQNPLCALALSGTNLYGVCNTAGSNFYGTVFRVDTNGRTFSVLHSFPASTDDGRAPSGGLILFGGILYGTTKLGGANGTGTIFQINPDGAGYGIVYSMPPSGIGSPVGTLALASGGLLVGVSLISPLVFYCSTNGSASGDQLTNDIPSLVDPVGPVQNLALGIFGSDLKGPNGNGAIFSDVTNGNPWVYNFTGDGSIDGASPNPILHAFGAFTLYGTCETSTNYGNGTIFHLSEYGTNFVLDYSFPSDNSEGCFPTQGFVQVGEALYSTTSGSTLADTNAYGTVFRWTP